MNWNPSGQKKWLLAAGKLLIVVLVLFAVSHTITAALDDLGKYPWHFDPAWLLFSGVLYLLGLLPAGLFWHRVLKTLRQDAKLSETLRAYFIGHLGKYVPGKALVVVIRVGLIRSRRVGAGAAAVSVFFETLTMMSVGAFLAAAIIAVRFRDQAWLLGVAVALMLAAGLPTLPPICVRLARLAGVGKADPSTGEALDRLSYGTLAAGWMFMTVSWILLGSSYWAVLRSMNVPDLDLIGQLPLCTAGVSLAMVAGFLSLVPGGAVVREAILAQLMVPLWGATAAIVSAVLLRLVWLASELLISGILWLNHRE